MATVQDLEGLDYYARADLMDKPETDLSQREGYYLNANSMHLAALPAVADVALRLTPADPHITFPPELRGVIFSGAPHLPENYAAILAYWSPLQVSALHEGAQYCQNLRNEYMVTFSPDPTPGLQQDVLLSDGLVVCVTGVRELVGRLPSEQFIEVQIPVSAQMLGPELDGFDSAEVDGLSCERIYLRVRDILDSPDPDFIAIAAIHTDLWDYGYYY